MNPLTLGQIYIPCILSFQVNGRNQKIWAQEVLILDPVCSLILLVVEEQRTLNRNACFGIFLYQGFHIGCQHGIDIHQTRQLFHAVLVLIVLEVGIRPVPLMGAHHRGEHGHLGPPEEQFLCPCVVKQGGVSSDIAVVQAAARHTGA